MPRKKKQKDIEESIDEAKAVDAKKNSELSDDERRALMLHHKKGYQLAERAVDEAKAVVTSRKADMKALVKRAQREYGAEIVSEIQTAILLEEPGGKLALEAEVARKFKVARWLGLPVGTEPTMFEMQDRRPAVDIAYDNGKAAGMEGDVCQPPHDPSVPQYQRWMEGWHDGQEILASAFKKLEPLDVPSEAPNTADTSDAPFVAPAGDVPAAPAMPA